MIYVGLDMSMVATGVCVKDGEKVKLATIKTTPKTCENDIERLKHIVREVMGLLPKEADLICIEDFFTPSSRFQMNAAIKLIGLGAVIRQALYDAKYPFFVVSPTQLKKYVTGKGNSKKNLILRDLSNKFGVDAGDDNQADACVLAYMAEQLHMKMKGNDISSLVKYQLETINKIVKDRPRYNC